MSVDYTIFDSLQDGVLVVDFSFSVYYANQAASNLLDVSVNRLKRARPLSDFISFENAVATPDEFPQEGFSPMREMIYTTPSQKSGALQVNLQIDSTTCRLKQNEKRWFIFLRDVSLEKILHKKYMGELDQKENVIKDLRKARAQLEDYSKNLELKVEDRTTELKSSNQLLAAILDSLDQGIVVFKNEGSILPYFSKMSRKIFAQEIENTHFAQLLSKKPERQKQLREWMSVVFEEILDFEDSRGLGPSKLEADITEREIALHYNPMRDLDGKLQAVVMVATDKTDEVLAKREAEFERAFAKRVVQITKFRMQFRSFAADATNILASLISDVKTSGSKLNLEVLARELHTFKGGAATFALNDLANGAHLAEQCLADYSKSLNAKEFLKKLLDCLLSLQTEFALFLEQNKELYGGSLSSGSKQVEISSETAFRWLAQLNTLKEAKELCIEIENLFVKEEIGSYFAYLDKSLSELATGLGKKLKPLVLVNRELRIEGKHYRELFSNMIHIFRNAIDHGLENPADRKQKNKDEAGLIQIQFQLIEVNSDRKIRILVTDDGQGIDPLKIRERMKNWVIQIRILIKTIMILSKLFSMIDSLAEKKSQKFQVEASVLRLLKLQPKN